MNIADAYLSGWLRMFDYGGTSSRLEYWSFIPINLVLWYSILWSITRLGIFVPTTDWRMGDILFLGWLLIVLLASLSLTTRRAREATHQGALALLVVIPVVGWVALLVIAALPPRART